MEDPLRLNQLYPSVGTDGGRTLLRLTPVPDCDKDCVVYKNCPYQKKGRCSVESQYLNMIYRTLVNPDPEKGISDQMNDFELQRVDHLMTLYHQRIRFLKVSYALGHKIETEDKKGGKKMHLVFAEIRAVTKDIEALMKSLALDKKWERKFGKLKSVGGQSMEEMMEKGDVGYYDEMSK